MPIFNFFSQNNIDGLWGEFRKNVESGSAEKFLETLLNLMSFMFVVNNDYRRNIQNFNGRYQFLDQDRKMTVGAIFANGRMKVVEKVIDDPHITITFRDGKTLLNFMISPRQDILGSMLKQDVKTEGNLNYLYRFGFLAKELQLMMPQV